MPPPRADEERRRTGDHRHQHAAGGVLGGKITFRVRRRRLTIPSRAFRSPTSSPGRRQIVIGHYNSGVTIPASEVYRKTASSRSRRHRPPGPSPSAAWWNIFRNLPAATIKQGHGRRPPTSWRTSQGQEDRFVNDKDHLRQGSRRRNLEDDQFRRHARGAVWKASTPARRTIRRWFQDQAVRRRPRLFRRALHRSRPCRAADARPGRHGAADGRDGITSDSSARSRPRVVRHADDLCPIRGKPAEAQAVVKEFRARNYDPGVLHALQLCPG